MTLPPITLPKVELPFDISVLLHPPVVHFMVALPVIILLLELLNLMFKKKAIGGISYFLIFVTIIVAAAAYLTGLVDGKEAYPALSEAGKTALSEHKLLGTYLLIASVVVFFFKFLSSVTKSGFMKFLYLMVLIVFVAGIYVQGEEGGKLVFKHGMNVEKVNSLDDALFDLQEEIDELTQKLEKIVPVPVPSISIKEEVKTIPKVPTISEVPTIQIPEETTATPATIKVEETPEVKIIPDVPAVEEAPEEATPTPVETLRTEIKEEVLPVMKETEETLQAMPKEMIQPQIATH